MTISSEMNKSKIQSERKLEQKRILDRFKEVTGFKNSVDIALGIGIGQPTVNRWQRGENEINLLPLLKYLRKINKIDFVNYVVFGISKIVEKPNLTVMDIDKFTEIEKKLQIQIEINKNLREWLTEEIQKQKI